MNLKRNALLSATVVAACVCVTAAAQGRQLTDQDYARAEQFLGYNTKPLVDHAVRTVTWLDGTHFWYRDHDASSDHYKIMDASTGKIKPAFDQKKLAATLSAAAGTTIKASKLDIEDFKIRPDGRLDITLKNENEESRAPGGRYVCDLSGKGKCVRWASAFEHKPGSQVGHAVVSPNGQYAVFVRDWNLWLRNLATGKETELTHDGVKNYGYATGNAGWVHDKGAIVRWSPDSTKVATYRQDQRKVGNMYTIQTRVGHPILHQWKYALPGDKHVFMIEPVVINVKTGKIVRLKMKAEERLSTLCDTLACNYDQPNTWSDVKWGPGGKTLALVTTSRDRRHERFRIADAKTGAVHTGFRFTAKDYYESGHGRVNWQYLPETNEAIWPTTQNDWLNLYLYSLKTGKEIRPLTTGRGNVDKVLYFDRKTRTLWFVGNARTPGINPYFNQFFKVDIGTGKTTLLTPEDADHTITMSPNGRYFVDSYSTPTTPPVTVLRSSADGHIIATVARADISRLKATGWAPPQIIKIKARDGKTTLYGLMYKPTNFDPHKKYPIVDYIYPGPQTGSVCSFSFLHTCGDNQALAELGFIVVAIDGMGTPWRSAGFHKKWYGDMGDNTLPDQVAAIKELARRYPWIDIHRVGIWGHSGGGFATADAMLSYPDFFKVGWAESGNYDNRNYENDWGEKYEGLLVTNKNGTSNYDNQAMELKAKNLKGHLMLVDGAIDDNVPHSNTFLLVNALIQANKNFDMLFLPNAHHGYGKDGPYVTRRRWDYFVRYLAGNTPPQEYRIHPPKGD